MQFTRAFYRDHVFVAPLNSYRENDSGNDRYGNDESSCLVAETKKLDFDLLTDQNELVYGKPTTSTMIRENAESTSEDRFMFDVFGPFNETEYSADLMFDVSPPRIDQSANEAIHRNMRVYYKRLVDMNMPDGTINKLDAIMREDRSSSAKLKVIKRKYDVGGLNVNWTAAIEVPFPEFRAIEHRARDSTKRLDIIYWNMTFRFNGKLFVFRVAFRSESDSPGASCNIECESGISLNLFAIIFHMLALYYKTQFVNFDGVILPIHPKLRLDSLAELTDFQREIARTVILHKEFVEDEKLTGAKPVEISKTLTSFVKYLGVRSYLECGSESTVVEVKDCDWRDLLRPISERMFNENSSSGISIVENKIIYK